MREILTREDYKYFCDDAVSVREEKVSIPSDDYKITKPIRLIELFAGIGSQAMALRNIGAEFEHYRVVEFDKYAIASYNAIHGTDFPVMDITKTTGDDLGIINREEYEYIMTYSFPCTDLSVAGRMEGMKKGSGTRSGLLWEVERLLKEVDELPQILLMENVPQVHGKDNIEDFKQWLKFLERMGYTNYYKDLNAKDYGVAQNRQRCFMVSILGDATYTFPKKKKLTKCVSDYLEEEVDAKYYIRSKRAQKLIEKLLENENVGTEDITPVQMNLGDARPVEQVAPTILARYESGIINQGASNLGLLIKNDNSLHHVGDMEGGYERNARVYAEDGAIPTLRAQSDTPNILTRREIIKEYNEKAEHQQDEVQDADGICRAIPAGTHGSTPHHLKTIVAMRGRNPENPTSRQAGLPTEQRLEMSDGVVCNTLTTVQKDNIVLEAVGNLYYDENGELEEGFNRQSGAVYGKDGLCPTLVTSGGGNHEPKILDEKSSAYCIRKLTPKECWRLMGFSDEDFDKAKKVNSNTQLYKQAGNSIVVNCLESIFKNLVNPPAKKVIKSYVTFTVYTEMEEEDYDNGEPVCLNSKDGRNGIEGLQPSVQDRVYDMEGIATAVTTSFRPGYKETVNV